MRDEGLGSWPARRARMTPGRTALVHGDRRLTYRDLHERVLRLANALRGRGVRPGDRVAYLGPNHPAFLETLFATAALGAVFVPLNTRLADPEIAYLLDDAGAAVLVSGPEHAATAAAVGDRPAVAHRVAVGDGYEELLAAAPADPVDERVTLADTCMIMYTSGTTGHPKGALLTHGNLTWNCYNLLIDLDVAGDEVALISAPMFHTAALNHTALPVFLKGGTNVLVGRFDPAGSFDLIAEHGVTLMFGVPAMFQQIALSPRWADADLSTLRILHCGGAPVPVPLIRTYQERGLTFVQGFGMTEASPGVLLLRAPDSVRKAGSAGTPMFFTDVRVVGPDGAEAAVGAPGEVLVHGPNVMAGYWRCPDETARTLDGGWLHSGDVATVDDEGFVTIVDRLKDMIISGGENVYPAEIESVLYEHPAVAECAVVGVPDERWGEVGRALVVLRDGATATPEEIRASLDGRLARYKIPRSVVVVDSLARNASGKLLRHRLRDQAAHPQESR